MAHIDKLKPPHKGLRLGRRRSLNLWANLDGRAVWRHPLEFFDLFVGKRDAARRPIFPAMEGAHPAASISNSVDHDVKTSGNTALGSMCAVISGRIGNVQRQMKTALHIPAVDLVNSFRRSHVALLFLRADRAAAQRNAVSLEPLVPAKDRQLTCRFLHEDAVDRRSREQGTPIVVCVKVHSQRQSADDDRQQSDLANHIGVLTA
jgi:hypothetical protein